MLYLLDTDHLSLWQRGTAEGVRIRERVLRLAPDDYGITIVTYAEQAKGWLADVARSETPDTEVRAFAKMQKSLTFCIAFAIWAYTADAALKCAELKATKVCVGTQDLRIASIALVNGATLLTRNARDFGKVPGLKFED